MRLLDGYVAVDLTDLRGQFCGKLLRDLGMEVIKVEPPGGDPVRGLGPFAHDVPHSEGSLRFAYLNAGKRSVVLDLSQAADRARLLGLVRRADVLLESFQPGTLARLGLDAGLLRAHNPGLIITSITGFGQTGPYRERPGLDQIAQGLSGFMSVTGTKDSGPIRAGIAIADLSAGVMLAYGIAVALLERERTGKGQWVHTSLLQANLRMMDFQATRWLMAGEVPPPSENFHPFHVPAGTFHAQDGDLNIQSSGDTLFRRLCNAIGAPDLADDPRFKRARDRQQRRDELTAEIEKYLAAKTKNEWVEILNAAGVPSGPILNVEESFANEQVQTLPMVQPLDHPELGTINILGFGVNLERTPARMRSAAPEHGEHTHEVLAELGYSEEQIGEMEREGAI